MPLSAREAAVNGLLAYRRRGARPDMVITSAAGELPHPRDLALALRLCAGVLQNQLFIDWHLERISGRSTGYFEPIVLEILRVSAYQLWFLERVPARAAVSEAVEITKRRAPGAVGLVNAVLRKLPQNVSNLEKVRARSRAAELSIEYSHPQWIVEELLGRFGAERTEAVLRADNEARPVSLAVNTLKTTPREALDLLREAGVTAETSAVSQIILLATGTGSLESLEAFRRGLVYVQDGAAWLAVKAASPEKGSRVLDMCSAPGGKSFAAAIMMENEGLISSRDISEKKLGLVESGARRLGIDIIETAASDGGLPRQEDRGAWDTVICDAPCSGLGVMAKKPEIRYKKPEELERLPQVQLRILAAAAEAVRPGGVLLYSTCTVRRQENEDVAEELLRRRPDFVPESFTMPSAFGENGGMVTILPDTAGTDGFFICKLRKRI